MLDRHLLRGSASESKNITFTPKQTGKYTFTLSGDVTDYDTDENQDISKTCEITVIEKQTPQEPEENNTGNEGQTPSAGQNTVIPQDPPKQEEPEESPKSQNNHLSSLVVSDGVRELQLKQTRTEKNGFNRDVEDYTVVFNDGYTFDELTSIKVTAKAEDSKAKISGQGSLQVNEGDNTFEIKCTAENGSVKTYRIKLTKPIIINKSELKLDSLQILQTNDKSEKENIILDKVFKQDEYEYEGSTDESIESVFVKLETSKVKDKDIIVKVNGKEIKRDLDGKLNEEEVKLTDGKNTIKITLISPVDENVQTDYVVTITKEAAALVSTNEVEEEEEGSLLENSKMPIIIIGVILIVIVLLSVTLVVLLIISYEVEGETEDEFFKDNKFLSDENLERLNNEYFKKVEKENTDEEIEKTEEMQNDKEVEETVKDLAEDLEEKEKEEDVFKKEDHIGRSRNRRGKHF